MHNSWGVFDSKPTRSCQSLLEDLSRKTSVCLSEFGLCHPLERTPKPSIKETPGTPSNQLTTAPLRNPFLGHPCILNASSGSSHRFQPQPTDGKPHTTPSFCGHKWRLTPSMDGPPKVACQSCQTRHPQTCVRLPGWQFWAPSNGGQTVKFDSWSFSNVLIRESPPSQSWLSFWHPKFPHWGN